MYPEGESPPDAVRFITLTEVKIMSLRVRLKNVLMFLLSILMALLVICTAIQVVFRYVLNMPLYWSDELARYLFIWIVFIGSAVAVENRAHLSLDFFYQKMPRLMRAIATAVIGLVACPFLLVVIITGVKLMGVTKDQPSAMMGIPMSIPYLAVPTGATLMVIYLAVTTIEDVKRILSSDSSKEEAGGGN